MKLRVFYMNPESFRDVSFEAQFGDSLPTRATMGATHIELKTIEVNSLNESYSAMQGEIWSPNGEACELIESKGLAHTSMTGGDIVENILTGEFFVLAKRGFVPLAE